MTDPSHPEKLPPAAATGANPPPRLTGNPLPPDAAEPGGPPPVSQLTAEEQMALFEKELKEKDWGHQPC